MMLIFALLYVLLKIVPFNSAYEFICPSQSHWKLRAESICLHQRNYSCLYDVNLQVNVYREKCIRPRILGPGYKYVFQPNPNRGSCSLKRYQPFIFKTIGYSNCVYLKSTCTSEGQIAYTNDNKRSDRTCTCNTETGYTFIRNLTNRCHCYPSREDCSCYIRNNPNNSMKKLKDENCDNEMKMTEIHLREDMFNVSWKKKNNDFDNYKYNLNYLPTNEYRIEAVTWVLVFSLAYCFVGLTLQRTMRRWIKIRMKEEVRGLQEETDPTKQVLVKMKRMKFLKEDHVPTHIKGKEKVTELQGDTYSNKQLLGISNKMEFVNEDPVPTNIREQMNKTVYEWKEKYGNFIFTRAYKEVLVKIGSKSCVAVTGPSGAGKSAIVQTVSLSLMTENDYEITIVSCPSDLKKYYKPGRKTVFVLDDVCGRFTAKEEQINDWYSMQGVVNQVTADESCKILFSCRLQVYKHPKFSMLTPFISCECNIISANLCLTNDEKKQIFKSHLNSGTITDNIISRKNDNFPLLCQLRSIRKDDLDIDKYFDMPYQVYKQELDNLRFFGKEQLCGLCLCIMYNNQLSEAFFEIRTLNFRKVINDICDSIGIDKQMSLTSLQEELETLETTYITKRNGFYEICHDALFDFMAFYFGQFMKQCFIDHADSGFLRERFLWINAFDTESVEYNIENIVHLEDNFLKYYIHRIISDWKLGKVSDALYNINMKSNLFRQELLKLLKQLDGSIAKTLSQKEDCFREDYASGNTPLIISCLGGYVEILKWLLHHGADINYCRGDGSSALYMGCAKQNVEIVNILLENKADVNLCTKEGVSPLGIACYCTGNMQIVKGLLQNKANVNQHRFRINNMTPLFMACEQNYITIVEELLQHGADPNICLTDGSSALLVACQKDYTELVHLLILYHADINAGMKDGDTPLFSASWNGFQKVTEMLLKHGANFRNLYSKEDIHKSLKGTSYTLKDKETLWFNSVMKIASSRVKEYVLTKSAEYVFDVFTGSSPLHVACFMGHFEVIKLLTEQFSDIIDVIKTDGTTPLFYACELGHINTVRLLLGKGADPNIKRHDEKTPLTIAELNCHTEILSLLTK